ncbi:type II toxin-antitoxin system HicA family toxin [Neptunomonas japonica]|uniref:HicA protein n=1 Tax=Neptunomonas japonica JAMM 1380 TaxID=1441457 RepID=A0A7R6PTU2_9GAMM|nr:type II toxin-antitoxin system HicA family toxin [Neptunomonas japonica]BBB29353.1 HicA protein [Neptunomonas japonica JAMM 1380]
MSRKEKLIQRLCKIPKDFTWTELQSLMKSVGFKEEPSGNGVKFICPETKVIFALHPPHPGNEVKRCYLKNIVARLKEMKRI